MSTGAIVAIVVVVVLVLIALLVLLPRMRAKRAQKQLDSHRSHAAEVHRTAAEEQAAKARLAEREAERARADARVHEARADLHDRGLADDELDGAPRVTRNGRADDRDPRTRDDGVADDGTGTPSATVDPHAERVDESGRPIR